MSNLCGTCDAVAVRNLPIGKGYKLRCPRCCSHRFGTWVLTEDYAGYREGFRTEVCMEGCGKILREEQLLG